jgi:hypothetical protein
LAIGGANDIAGATSNTFTPAAIVTATIARRWYRLYVSDAASGCASYSTPIEIDWLGSGGWTGTTNDWSTASNWCGNSVPTSATSVVIEPFPSGSGKFMPVVGTADANVKNLTINKTTSGGLGSVTITGAHALNIFGNVTNSGTFTDNAGSTVALQGSTTQTLTGINVLNNLTFNNSASAPSVTFSGSNVSVSGTLTLTQGTINLNSLTLTLGTSAGTTGTLGYTGGWFYGGNFRRWVASPVLADGNIRGLFPMGSSSDTRPFYVSFPVTVPTTGGTITLSHTGAITTSVVSVADTGGPIVRRQDSFWSVATNMLAGGTYNLRGEGTGFGTVGNVADLRLMLAGSVVATAGANAGTLTDPQVSRTGLTLANLTNSFYIGSVNAATSPLPITLTDFFASPEKEGINLHWVTESEINFDHFQLERSSDGEEFISIAKVGAKGTVSSRTEYAYLDAHTFGRNYYRLKCIDLDGSSAFSSVLLVDAGTLYAVYPNPITDHKFTLEFFDNDPAVTEVILMDQLGRVCYTKVVNHAHQLMELPESIGPGIYFLKVTKGATHTVQKVSVL